MSYIMQYYQKDTSEIVCFFFCNDQNKNFARNNQYIRQHLTPDGEYTLGSFPTINES